MIADLHAPMPPALYLETTRIAARGGHALRPGSPNAGTIVDGGLAHVPRPRGCRIELTPVTPAARRLGIRAMVTEWCG